MMHGHTNIKSILPICDSREMEDSSGIRVKFISDLQHFRLLMGYSRERILTKKTKQFVAARKQ